MLYLQPRLGVLRRGTVDVQGNGTAHHHVGHLADVGVLCAHVAHEGAPAQHGHPVGHVHDLVEFVGDYHHGLARVPHVAQHGKQLVRLLRGENGGGFVQNEDVRAPVQHLHYLHGLLLGHGHVVDLLVWVHLEAVGVADLPHPPCGGLYVQSARLLQPQNDILRGGEHVHQLEVLVYHADAQVEGVLGRTDGYRLVVDVDLALVRVVDAGEHVHKRGLAAAVFTQQRQNLALVNVQPALVVCRHRSEALGDVSHFYGCLRVHFNHHFTLF